MTSETMLEILENALVYKLLAAREEANKYTGPDHFHLGYLLGKQLAYDEMCRQITELREYTPA